MHPYVDLIDRALRGRTYRERLWLDDDLSSLLLVEQQKFDWQSATGSPVGSEPQRKMRALAELVGAVSLRLLNPRLRMLTRHLETAINADASTFNAQYTRARLGKLSDGLQKLMPRQSAQSANDNFISLVSELPADLEVYSMYTHELIESYFASLARVQDEAQHAAELAAQKLAAYIEVLKRVEDEQIHESTDLERRQLEQRLSSITAKLDGPLLHTERLQFKREVDELYTKLETRLSRQERKALELRYAEVGTKFQNLENSRQRLIAQRDFIRSRLEQLRHNDLNRSSVGKAAYDEVPARHELQGALTKRANAFKRLAQVIKPLSAFDWKAILTEHKDPDFGRIFKLWQEVASNVLARNATERTFQTVVQVLETYWRNPIDLLRVVCVEAEMLAVDRGQEPTKQQVSVDDWVNTISARIESGETVEQFLLSTCRTAPECLREHLTFIYNHVSLAE